MDAYEQKTSGKCSPSPTNGLMFDDITLTSQKPLDRDYAERHSRWEPLIEVTQYDAKFFGVKRLEDVPASIQERAYSSPIWYNPQE